MKKGTRYIVFLLLVCAGFLARPHASYAQAVPDTTLNNIIDDTLHEKKAGPGIVMVTPKGSGIRDTIVTKKGPFQPNPKKAGLYSAIVPGLGQLYNRQYWKIPVVYAGLGLAGYFFADNLTKYRSYRKAYIGRIGNPYPTDEYVKTLSTTQLQQYQNDYSKYLDLTVLLTTIGYALQVMDAVTSAHLKNFDISRDISLRMKPVVTQNGIGLGLAMNF